MYRARPNGGYFPIRVPRLDIPYIQHDSGNNGVGRGEGDNNTVIQKGKPKPGKGKGGEAGDDHDENGITIEIELEEVFLAMEQELGLPPMKPKPSDVLEQEEIRYTSISKVGPESLRHTRRTMLQALKRQSAMGEMKKKRLLPGFNVPITTISPIKEDKRYRQYKVVKKPSSNACIFFARDGSFSMDETRCEYINDVCYWIDLWIRRYYKRVERCYIWHDSIAEEVDEAKFYTYRGGGGTKCSSALDLISHQFEARFPPSNWNFYVFYFTDGENQSDDNPKFVETLRKNFPESIVNLVGICQVLADYKDSLKRAIDLSLDNDPMVNVITTSIEKPSGVDTNAKGYGISDEDRGRITKKAICDLLGAKKQTKADF